jgi:hypothetical protein
LLLIHLFPGCDLEIASIKSSYITLQQALTIILAEFAGMNQKLLVHECRAIERNVMTDLAVSHRHQVEERVGVRDFFPII